MATTKEREAVAAKLDRHAQEEGRILDEYRALAAKLGSESPLGFLIDLILTEEEMHHLLLSTMARWLREAPALREDPGARGVSREELLALTRTLKDHEWETIEATRALKPQLSDELREVLESLLDVVVLDSEKHHRLLATVEKMIEA